MVAGSVLRRLRILVTTVVVFSILTLTTDLLLTRLALVGGPGPFGVLGNTVAGLQRHCRPGGRRLHHCRPAAQRDRQDRAQALPLQLVLLAMTALVTISAVWAIKYYWTGILVLIAKVPLLGGIASVIVIFFTIFPVTLYLVDSFRRKLSGVDPTTLPSVGVVVPARNEEGLIGDCIRAIDRGGRWLSGTLLGLYGGKRLIRSDLSGSRDAIAKPGTFGACCSPASPGKGVRAQLGKGPACDRGDRAAHRRRHAGDPIGASSACSGTSTTRRSAGAAACRCPGPVKLDLPDAGARGLLPGRLQAKRLQRDRRDRRAARRRSSPTGATW